MTPDHAWDICWLTSLARRGHTNHGPGLVLERLHALGESSSTRNLVFEHTAEYVTFEQAARFGWLVAHTCHAEVAHEGNGVGELSVSNIRTGSAISDLARMLCQYTPSSEAVLLTVYEYPDAPDEGELLAIELCACERGIVN